MTGGVVDWMEAISGFSGERWWRLIVCTNSGAHDLQVLGLIFDHDDGRLHWAPRTVYLNAEHTSARVLIKGSRLDDQSRADVRARGIEGRAAYGHGSINCACPLGCDWRISEEHWLQLIDEARRVSPSWVDLSLYG